MENPMILTNHIMTEDEKWEICAWKYTGEYEIYNLPSYEEMKRKRISFLNPTKENNFRAFYDGDALVGFVNISEEEKEVLIGIGTPLFKGKNVEQEGGQLLSESWI